MIRRLWVRKHWAVGALAACLMLSWVYLERLQPLFEIQANLLLRPDAHGLKTNEKQNGRPDGELIATQSEIFASRRLIARAVQAYEQAYEQANELPATDELPIEETLPGEGTLSVEETGAIDAELLAERLADQIVVKRIVGTRILNVSLRWDDREQGEALTRNLVDQYELFLSELNQGGQVEALKTLTQTERSMRLELTELQRRYRELRQASALVGDGDEGLKHQQALLQEFGTAYAEVRSRRIALENRLATIYDERAEVHVAMPNPAAGREGDKEFVSTSKVAGDAVALTAARGTSPDQDMAVDSAVTERGWGALQMLNDIDVKGLQDPIAIQQELFQAEVRRQELIETYSEKHPEIRAVESQIADWKRRLQTLVTRAPLTLDRELRAAASQEDRLRKLYEKELATAKELDQQRLEQLHLQTEMEQVQALHNSVLTQLTELRLNNQVTTEGGADLRVTVLDEPVASVQPIWPNKKLIMGGGLLMGMLASCALILIPLPSHESRDNRR